MKLHTPFKPLQVVKEYFAVDDAVANSVLWTCTGWPHFFRTSETMNQEDCLREQLREYAMRSNGCAVAAMNLADQDMDEAMAKFKRDNPD
jgi:hypothetical protein